MPTPETRKQILIFDRDIATVEPLRARLSEVGFISRIISDGAAALVAVAERPPDLVIVDWNMPGFGASELILGVRRARTSHVVRLIILSTLSGEQDVVTGLNLGADDYIAKPFSLREAVARAAAVLRAPTCDYQCQVLSSGELALDPASKRVTVRGRPVHLRGIEHRLLEFFMEHAGYTLSRAQLLERVWGDDRDVDERTVDVNVQRLRKILKISGCDPLIQTERGAGYRFVAAAPESVE